MGGEDRNGGCIRIRVRFAALFALVAAAVGGRADANALSWADVRAAAARKGTTQTVVSRSDALAVTTAERRSGVGPCSPGNCVSNEVELRNALDEIANAGGVGSVTLCSESPIVLTPGLIILTSEFFTDVTIECCDVRERRFPSTLPACFIVRDPRCGQFSQVGDTNSCSIFTEEISLTLRGIDFDGGEFNDPDTQVVGPVAFNAFESADRLSLLVADCIFRNTNDGTVFILNDIDDVIFRVRALTVVFGENFSGSVSVGIERTGFFDNDSGGLIVLTAGGFGSDDKAVSVHVSESQFENNQLGGDPDVEDSIFDDNGGIAVIGRFESLVVENSRFFDNFSPKRGAAIQIDTNVTGTGFTGVTSGSSVALRDNKFERNQCMSGDGERTNGGAVFISFAGVSDGSITVEGSDFVDNAVSPVPGAVVGLATLSEGGGLYVQNVQDGGSVSIARCDFHRNTAQDAAAIFLANVESASIVRSEIQSNEAELSTSAVKYKNLVARGVVRGSLAVSRSKFRKNTGANVKSLVAQVSSSPS